MDTRIEKYKPKRDYIYNLDNDSKANLNDYVKDLNIISPKLFKNYEIKANDAEYNDRKNKKESLTNTQKSNLAHILKEIQIDSYSWDNKKINYSRIYNKKRKISSKSSKKKNYFYIKTLAISLFIVIMLILFILLIL